ncbi:uncharacterized protein TNCV_3235701 [Trichonephila clavipes]|nr:uncharacterized protein TNCV_3235701 [Trichonephila clavipes]
MNQLALCRDKGGGGRTKTAVARGHRVPQGGAPHTLRNTAVEEDRKKEAENRLREKELELELARLNARVNSNNERAEHSIKKFWEIENVEIDSVKTSDLDICEDHFKNTHSRDDQGRYTVAMPLKEDPSCLGESRQTAIQRLNSLWKRLSRDKE